jgi:PAS domain S-box-containing protein
MPDGGAARAGDLNAAISRLAVEACPGGILAVNSAGVIVMVNREIERLFGYTRDELHGQSVDILLPKNLRGRHAGHRAAFMAHPNARHVGTRRDFNGRHKDGTEFAIEVGLSPIRTGGEVLVLCAIIDISERKRLERLQDEFVSTVSHELRTPMTSIAGSLGLLVGGGAGTLPSAATRLVTIAYANCQRLVRLVNDILDIKKLESGLMAFNFQRCEAFALLERAIEVNRAIADAYDVRIRFDGSPDPFDIRVDPDRFVQVITNLLSNALKFSLPGTEVAIAIENRGDVAHITVRDHGPGIPAEFKPLVFEKFAQADTGNGVHQTGTGLGLSIVRQIIMRMNGQIGFDDAPGGGTIFSVDLPCADHLASWQAEFADGASLAPLLPVAEPAAALAHAGLAGRAS